PVCHGAKMKSWSRHTLSRRAGKENLNREAARSPEASRNSIECREMSLAVGTKVGAYEVISLVGKGGMGEVYRARDTQLERDVALKLVPDAMQSDPERLSRFRREAKVLASLNHSNVAQIYGLEQTAGAPCIVMELLEGETCARTLRASRSLG